ncbi:MAG: hypothetical protein J6Y03_02490 [Alphaproteobacteria bacterium]|nr:hypothetical protein [Alphaproteobacteria bacterium]
MERKNIDTKDFAGVTFNQYDLVCTYIKNGETLYDLVPFGPASQEYPVLLVSKNGQNILLDETQFDFGKHPEFAWAQNTYKKLREDIKKLDSLPSEEGAVWQLFKSQGGFLALCEDGGADDLIKSLNGKRDFPTEHHTEGGQTLTAFPVISVNSSMDYSDDRVLLHELTHNACFTLINYGQSDLFKTIIEVERANHSSDILSRLNAAMDYQISGGNYTEDNRYDELLPRLHEERLKDPVEFKKQLPLLNCFFQNYLYPSVLAHTYGHSQTVDKFSNSLISPEAKKIFSLIYAQAHQRVTGQSEYDLKLKNILMPINKNGYRQSDPNAKDSPAYHQAYSEQQRYQKESETKMHPFCEQLVSFMESVKSQSEVQEKSDREGLRQYLQKYSNATSKSEAKGEYEGLKRSDPVGNAWRNLPKLLNFIRKGPNSQ